MSKNIQTLTFITPGKREVKKSATMLPPSNEVRKMVLDLVNEHLRAEKEIEGRYPEAVEYYGFETQPGRARFLKENPEVYDQLEDMRNDKYAEQGRYYVTLIQIVVDREKTPGETLGLIDTPFEGEFWQAQEFPPIEKFERSFRGIIAI
jgi:hypothetical protein